MSDENQTEDGNGVGAVFGGEVNTSTDAKAGESKSSGEAKPAKKAAPKKKAPAKSAAPKPETVRIKLAHSKDIPPSGLYLGHNGRGYLLKPGVEADVPEFLLDVLDHAVQARPVTGPNGQVKGWEDQPRFMYSIVRNK